MILNIINIHYLKKFFISTMDSGYNWKLFGVSASVGLCSLIFDEKIDQSVYNVHELYQNLADATDGHKFGTFLVDAINKRMKNCCFFPLEVDSVIALFKGFIAAKVEGNEEGARLFYNYMEEEWQILDA